MRARVLAVAGLALAAAGCALAPATPPSVDVLDVRLTGLGLGAQQLSVALCVTNPNRQELAFRQVTANLDVSGLPLAAATSDTPVRLPPLLSTVVPFTVATTTRNLPPQLASVLTTGAVSYRLHGTVTLAGGLALTVPYARSGRLDTLAAGLQLADASSDPSPCQSTAPPTAR